MKIVLVAAARPNFMKVAPILEALRLHQQTRRDLELLLVHTGQHYDKSMSESFFEDLGIQAPDINLGVGSGTHAEQTARVMVAFEAVCMAHRPDWVVVVGDVNSTLACALTSKKLGIRLAHVESGLRSRDMSMPEEINRICTDAIADLLFTTDRTAGQNLLMEGIAESRIHFVGNTMIDTLLRHVEHARSLPLGTGLAAGNYAVLTLHRPSNVDDCKVLAGILDAVDVVADQMPVVFPAHPRTAKILGSRSTHPNLRVIEPLSYLPFLGLVASAKMVLTDSGGIQEETTVLRIPCLTLRSSTERPITCEIGTNVLVGTDPARIRDAALRALNGSVPKASIPEMWDGHAAERIVKVLVEAMPAGGQARR